MLQRLLDDRGVTAAQLAERLGVTEGTVRHWLRQGVRIGWVTRIALMLDLTETETRRLEACARLADEARVTARLSSRGSASLGGAE